MITYLNGEDPIPHMREKLDKAERRLKTDGLKGTVVSLMGNRWLVKMRPHIEQAHRARELDARGEDDLADIDKLALWRFIYDAGVRLHILELSVLYVHDRNIEPGRFGAGVMGAYCIGLHLPDAYHVFDSKMVTAQRRYSPGRLLEADLIDRLRKEGQHRVIEWGNGEHTEALIVRSE